MADNVNKPKGRRADTSGLGQVFRKVAQAAKPGVEETRLQAIQEALQSRMEDLQDRIEQVQSSGEDVEDLMKEIASIGAPLGTVETRLEGFTAGRQTAIQKVTQQQIGKFAGERASGQRVRAIGKRPEVYGQASEMSSQVPSSELQQNHEQSVSRAAELRETLIEKAQAGAPQKVLESIAGGILGHEQQAAVSGAAIAAQRRRGETTQQIHEQGMRLTGVVAQERRAREIQEEATTNVSTGDPRHISQGGFSGTQKQRDKALEEATKNLTKTFKEFDEALENGSETLADTESAYKKAQKTFKEASIAQGAGRGGGSDILEQVAKFFTSKTTGAVLNIGGEALKQVGAATRMFGVELPMRRAEVQAGFADMANRQYKDVRNAAENFDIASARRIMGSYNVAAEFGEGVGTAENVAIMAETGGQAMQDAATTIRKGAATDISGAGVAGLQGVGRGLRGAALVTTGIQGAEKNLAAQRSALKVNDAINMMRDTNTQDFIDFTQTTGLATRGLGGARERTLAGDKATNQRGMFDESSIRDLANVGIKSSQIAALTQTGVNALGADFRGVETLQRAGVAQKAGIMTAEQFVTQAGSLSTMGGGSDQLEKIMRQAVSAGMDNSKNIQQMVSATIALSADMAAAGQDVTGGQSDILASQTQALSDVAVNQRAAIAQRASAVMNAAGGDRDLNIFTVQRAAATRKLLAGKNIGFAGFEAALTTAPNTLRDIRSKIQEGDEEGAVKAARAAGLGRTLVNKQGGIDEDMLEGLEGISRNDQINRLLSFGKVSKKVEKDIRSKINSPENIDKTPAQIWETLDQESKDEIQALGQTHRAGRVSGKSLFVGSATIGDIKPSENPPNTSDDSMSGQIEKSQQIQAQAQAKPIIDGMKNLGTTFKDALKTTNDVFGTLTKQFDPKKMQENAELAAKSFEVPIGVFKDSTGVFNDAVIAFSDLIKNDFEDNPEFADRMKKMRAQAEDARDKSKKSGGD